MLLLRLFAVIVVSLISLALCKQVTVDLIEQLGQDPSLKADAIKSGQRVDVEIMNPQSAIVAEEGVTVNIDCLPWFGNWSSNDTSWQIKWVLQRRNESGDSKTLETRTMYL